jgi:hypothetical protein
MDEERAAHAKRAILSASLPIDRLVAALADGPAVLAGGPAPVPRSQGDWALLRARGACALWLEVEAASREAHDALVGRVGACDRLATTLAAARAAGLPVWATTRVTRSNDRVLARTATWLGEARVQGWALALARVDDEPTARRTLPSLGLALPHVLRAADLATRAGVEVVLAGFPRCLLGPFAALAAPEGPAAEGAPCDECAARAACAGLAPLHRARFGARELQRVAPVPSLAGPIRDGLAALVTGCEV